MKKSYDLQKNLDYYITKCVEKTIKSKNHKEIGVLNNLKEENLDTFMNSCLSIEQKIRILSKVKKDSKLYSDLFQYVLNINYSKQTKTKEDKNNELLLILFQEEKITKKNEDKDLHLQFGQVINPRKEEIRMNQGKSKLQELSKTQESFSMNMEKQKESNANKNKELEDNQGVISKRIQDLEKEKDNIKTRLQESETKIRHLNDELTKNVTLSQSLSKENDHLKGEVNSLKTQVGSLQTEVNSLKSQVGSLQTEVNSLKTEANPLKADAVSLKKEFNSLITDITPLKNEVNSLKEEMNSTQRRQKELLLNQFQKEYDNLLLMNHASYPTPLHYAAFYNAKEIGELLLSKEIDINAKDIDCQKIVILLLKL